MTAITTPAKEELVSPTGQLATAADPGTEEWFNARRQGITGTDLPKILGDSQYGNALTVWHDKRGTVRDEDAMSEAGEWGHILEDPVAQEWAGRHGFQVARIGVIHHAEHTWRRASLDRLVHGCPDADVCGLEVKTRSAFKQGLFRDDIPDDVLAQVAWGRMVSGLPHMHVAVLIGGQYLFEFTYFPDEQLEAYLIERAEPIWQAVEQGVPPDVEPDADGVLIGLLNSLYDVRVGVRQLPAKEVVKYVADYQLAHDAEKSAKSKKEKAKAGLIQLLDDGEIGMVDDRVVFTYLTPRATETIPAGNLRDLKDLDPALYERLVAGDWIKTSEPGPRFDLKK